MPPVTHLPGYDRTLIVVLTGRRDLSDLKQVLDAGADDYWTKPMDLTEFEARLTVAERQVRNIAERLRAEDALRESVERFELVAEGTNDGIYDGKVPSPDWLSPDVPFWYSAGSRRCWDFATTNFPIGAAPGSNACIPTIGRACWPHSMPIFVIEFPTTSNIDSKPRAANTAGSAAGDVPCGMRTATPPGSPAPCATSPRANGPKKRFAASNGCCDNCSTCTNANGNCSPMKSTTVSASR